MPPKKGSNKVLINASPIAPPILRVKLNTAAVLARDTIRKEMALGARTVFDLLVAERAVLDAKTQLVINQQAQVVASYQLLADLVRL